MQTDLRHQCLIYDGPPSQKLRLIAGVLQQKLEEGYRCLYLNSAPMVAGMRSTLAAMDIDVTYEIARASLVLSAEPVSPPGSEFDCELMLAKLEDSLDQALNDGYKGLWATGDMTWEFGPGKDFSKLIEYEWGLEDLFKRRKEICGICQYHHDTLPHDALRQGLSVHPAVVINNTLSRVNPHYLRSGSAEPKNNSAELDDMITALCNL